MAATSILRFLLFYALAVGFAQMVGAQRSGQLAASDVFRSAKNSVVLIVGSAQEQVVQGSGFVEATDRVVTNFHVIDGLDQIFVKFADGGVVRVQSVVKADKNVDLAVLDVPTGSRRGLALGDELALHEGDNVLALGAPKGLQLTLTNGIVSSFRHDEHSFLIQTTAPIAPGSSGGPLLDSAGRVVGITTFRISDSPGLYFSVAVSELKRLLRTTSTRVIAAAANDDELEGLRKEIDVGRMDAATTRANALLSRDPENARGLAIKGILAYHQDHPEEAVKLLARASAREPDSQVVQSFYALTLIQIGDFKKALIHAKRGEDLQQTELSERALALSAYLLNDLPTAEHSAQKMVEIDENNETALEILAGVAYWEAPEKPTWLARARELKKVNPNGSWATILDWLESTPRDNRKLELAKSAKFPNELPFTLLSGLRLNSPAGADFGAAATELKPALASMPENSRLLQHAIFVDLLQNNLIAASEHLSTLTDSTADPEQTHAAGCIYYMAVGNPTTAIPECKAVLESKPNSHTAHSNYAWALFDAGEYSSALEEFNKARSLMQPQNWTKTAGIDLTWGLLLSNWWTGNEGEAKKLHDLLFSSGFEYVNVSELKKLPLVWSRNQLGKIQGANDKWTH